MRVWIYMYILKVALSETSSHHHTFKEIGHSHQSWTQKKKGFSNIEFTFAWQDKRYQHFV